MDSKCHEQIKLLVFAEEYTLRNNFVADLQGFLQNEKYEPNNETDLCFGVSGVTTFQVELRQFHIIRTPIINETDNFKEISSKLSKLQKHFIQQLNLNAIIFLVKPDSMRYKRFLSLSLSNFSKDDISRIEKNVIFVFVHDEPVSYKKMYKVDADLWTDLNETSVDLLHSKTFHYNSRLDMEFCKTFVQFICMNKKTLPVETAYFHESVLEVVEDEDFLDLIMVLLFLNEDNIYFRAKVERERYVLFKRNDYFTICNNQKCSKFQWCCDCYKVKTRSHLKLCGALKNPSACEKCNCPISDHKAVKYKIMKNVGRKPITELQYKKNRHKIIATMVKIDLLNKNNNPSVGPLYNTIKKRIAREPSYSVLEALYEYEMVCRETAVTADDCMKCILKLFKSLDGNLLCNFHWGNPLTPRGQLRVKI